MSGRIQVTPDLLLRAYSIGLFPMAETRDASSIFWIDPERRGVLPLDRFHVPRRLRRTVRRSSYTITCDTDFDRVIEGCAQITDDRRDTWINDEIRHLYRELFRRGLVHTLEVRNGDELVGGLYGVALGSVFFGESMFSRVRDASKIALVHLAARLHHGGFTLLDTQFITPHLAQFGAIEVPRRTYRDMLNRALQRSAAFPIDLSIAALEEYLTLSAERAEAPP